MDDGWLSPICSSWDCQKSWGSHHNLWKGKIILLASSPASMYQITTGTYSQLQSVVNWMSYPENE
jgi:hypothetical protein